MLSAFHIVFWILKNKNNLEFPSVSLNSNLISIYFQSRVMESHVIERILQPVLMRAKSVYVMRTLLMMERVTVMVSPSI